MYPAEEGLELSEDGKQLVVSFEQQWTDDNVQIFRVSSAILDQHSQILKEKYGHRAGRSLQFPIGKVDLYEIPIMLYLNLICMFRGEMIYYIITNIAQPCVSKTLSLIFKDGKVPQPLNPSTTRKECTPYWTLKSWLKPGFCQILI